MVKLNTLAWFIELCDKEVSLWSWFLKYSPIRYLSLTIDEILMPWCNGDVVDVNIYMTMLNMWYSLTLWYNRSIDAWTCYRHVYDLNEDDWSGFPFRGKISP